MAGELNLHDEVLADLAARLDLREPNRLAIETLAAEVSQYYDVDDKQPPLEAVFDVATGVGKTYILAGAMELLVAAHGVRDFVVVTPGNTILRKNLDNFSPGFTGLRGTPEEIRTASAAVGVPGPQRSGPQPTLPGRPDAHEHQPGTAPHEHDGPLGYGVDHSSAIFAYDVHDRLPVIYRGRTPPSDLAADLPALAREESS